MRCANTGQKCVAVCALSLFPLALATVAFFLAVPAFSQDDLPNAIRVRVVDEAGSPVAGAWIGTHASSFPELKGDWRLSPLQGRRVFTDDDGRAAITMDIRVDSTDLLWAWYRDRGLVGGLEVNRDMYGGPETELVVQPACRVRGKLASPELEALDRAITWTNVYLHIDDHRPLSFSSEDGVFEFALPPGRYTLNAYGRDLANEYREIEVRPGMRELHIGTIQIPATRLAKLYGQPAPEFREIKAWMNGEPTTLERLHGRYVLLDFWGYWCGPCIDAMPELMMIHDALADRGLTVIGVHDDSIESIDALEDRLAPIREQRWENRRIPFRVALDGGGERTIEGASNTTRGATTAAFGVTSFPTTVLIGPDGTILERFHAPTPEKAINQLAELMNVEPKRPDWREELHAAYRIGEDEVLRLAERPFTPARSEYFRELAVRQNQVSSGIRAHIPRHAVWTWEDGDLEGYDVWGALHLKSALAILSDWKVYRHYVEGDPGLLEWSVPGDLIMKASSTTEERFKALARIASEIMGEHVGIEARTGEEKAVVVRGTYEFKSLGQVWQPRGVHVYSDRFDEEDSGGGSGTVEKFCRFIGQVVGLPFVDETESSETELWWLHHGSGHLAKLTESERQRLLPTLLKNLAEQTGLQFSVELRPIEKWRIERIEALVRKRADGIQSERKDPQEEP